MKRITKLLSTKVLLSGLMVGLLLATAQALSELRPVHAEVVSRAASILHLGAWCGIWKRWRRGSNSAGRPIWPGVPRSLLALTSVSGKLGR